LLLLLLFLWTVVVVASVVVVAAAVVVVVVVVVADVPALPLPKLLLAFCHRSLHYQYPCNKESDVRCTV